MEQQVLIGTHTDTLPHDGATGLLSGTFDGTRVTGVVMAAPLTNPTCIALSPDGSTVYAVEETGPDGSISAFERAENGGLIVFGRESAGGAAPTHLVAHPSGRFLLTGTYGGGTVSVWSLDRRGMPEKLTAFIHHRAADRLGAVSRIRQVSVDPVTGDIVVVDSGLGEVRWYGFADDGMLTPRPEATVAIGASRPRRLAFHPDGRHAFLVSERDSALVLLRRDGDRFTVAGSVSARAPGVSGPNWPAALRVTEDGRAVLVANCGDDTVTVFAFDPAAADSAAAPDAAAPALALAAFAPAGGRSPRDLIVSPGGDRVLVACQGSDSIAVFAFESESLRLELLGTSPAPVPACILFTPPRGA